MSNDKRKAACFRRRAARAKSLLALPALLALMLILFGCTKTGAPEYQAPVIQGVQPELTAAEGSDIRAVLLSGVTAVGGSDRPGQVFPVTVEVYDQSNNTVDPAACTPGTYRVVYSCNLSSSAAAAMQQAQLTVTSSDTEAPVIAGTRDLEVPAGGSISYREGVTVTDNRDASVPLKIDTSGVNLTEPGLYMAVYSATDSAGNRAEVVIQVTVTEALEDAPEVILPPIPDVVTREMVDELCDKILAGILKDGMSQKDKAHQIFKYVYSHIKYVGTSDKSDWLRGAYTGFLHGRGDCYNYFACSKALLTRAGIPNLDLCRAGGTSRHYWQLIDVGEGWHHFDACWQPTGYVVEAFHLTEAEARAYTELVSGVRQNYYVYDYDNCPVIPVGTPEEEAQARLELWAAREQAGTEGGEVVDPNAPAEPVAPVDPDAPVEPVAPVDPNAPVEPVAPVDPNAPVEPVAPVDPNAPVEPVAPVDPNAPVEPVAPVDPNAPVEPVAPVDPNAPVNPVVPVDPNAPTEGTEAESPVVAGPTTGPEPAPAAE